MNANSLGAHTRDKRYMCDSASTHMVIFLVLFLHLFFFSSTSEDGNLTNHRDKSMTKDFWFAVNRFFFLYFYFWLFFVFIFCSQCPILCVRTNMILIKIEFFCTCFIDCVVHARKFNYVNSKFHSINTYISIILWMRDISSFSLSFWFRFFFFFNFVNVFIIVQYSTCNKNDLHSWTALQKMWINCQAIQAVPA